MKINTVQKTVESITFFHDSLFNLQQISLYSTYISHRLTEFHRSTRIQNNHLVLPGIKWKWSIEPVSAFTDNVLHSVALGTDILLALLEKQ